MYLSGPPNLPIVGSVPYLLGYNGVLDTFFNLTKKYGPILGYISNGRPKVILGDADMIRKIFSLPEVTSRPPQGSRGKFRYGQATGILYFISKYYHTVQRSCYRSTLQ